MKGFKSGFKTGFTFKNVLLGLAFGSLSSSCVILTSLIIDRTRYNKEYRMNRLPEAREIMFYEEGKRIRQNRERRVKDRE